MTVRTTASVVRNNLGAAWRGFLWTVPDAHRIAHCPHTVYVHIHIVCSVDVHLNLAEHKVYWERLSRRNKKSAAVSSFVRMFPGLPEHTHTHTYRQTWSPVERIWFEAQLCSKIATLNEACFFYMRFPLPYAQDHIFSNIIWACMKCVSTKVLSDCKGPQSMLGRYLYKCRIKVSSLDYLTYFGEWPLPRLIKWGIQHMFRLKLSMCWSCREINTIRTPGMRLAVQCDCFWPSTIPKHWIIGIARDQNSGYRPPWRIAQDGI